MRSLSVDRNLGNGKIRHEKIKMTPTGSEKVDPSKNALVITGQALIHALADFPHLFLQLGELCNSVRSSAARSLYLRERTALFSLAYARSLPAVRSRPSLSCSALVRFLPCR